MAKRKTTVHNKKSIFKSVDGLSGQKRTIVSKMRMLRALEKTYGIVTPATQKVGIDRTRHYEWLKTDPVYAEAVDDLVILKKDFAEHKLFELAEQGVPQCVIEVNKKVNRDRNYGDKMDLGIGLNPGTHNKKIFIPDNGRDVKNTIDIPFELSQPPKLNGNGHAGNGSDIQKAG